MGSVVGVDQSGLQAVRVKTGHSLERETVLSLLSAKKAYESLAELGLDMQHVAVLGAVTKLALQRLVSVDRGAATLPANIPDYAFHPVQALRVTRETGVPHATLRRRLEELVEHGLLEKGDGGYVPTMGGPSMLAGKLQRALFDSWQNPGGS